MVYRTSVFDAPEVVSADRIAATLAVELVEVSTAREDIGSDEPSEDEANEFKILDTDPTLPNTVDSPGIEIPKAPNAPERDAIDPRDDKAEGSWNAPEDCDFIIFSIAIFLENVSNVFVTDPTFNTDTGRCADCTKLTAAPNCPRIWDINDNKFVLLLLPSVASVWLFCTFFA